jgi:hypothetical protein
MVVAADVFHPANGELNPVMLLKMFEKSVISFTHQLLILPYMAMITGSVNLLTALLSSVLLVKHNAFMAEPLGNLG